jgi:alkanesulfonate monooxygenase SsuD/methylene tetrahydromethanopterin reductase-like flavin-dependent oxidoreductase (luciferase family)
MLGGPQTDWPAFFDWALEAEGLGFEGYWTADHPAFWNDTWTTLAAVATRTRSLRLGTIVSCIPLRQPALLARLASDVDHLSEGRLVLGIGMGWLVQEFAQLGLPFPSLKERQAGLEEAITILNGVWYAAPFTFNGRHFSTTAGAIQPPRQQPRVPVLIGGGGERVTLRQVAQHADACNFGPDPNAGNAGSLDDVRRKFEALERHCVVLGRDPRSVLRSHLLFPVVLREHAADVDREQIPATGFAGTPSELESYYRPLVRVGMEYFIVGLNHNDFESLRLLNRVASNITGAGSS